MGSACSKDKVTPVVGGDAPSSSSSAELNTGLAPRAVHSAPTSGGLAPAPDSPSSREFKFDCFLSHKRSDCELV